MRRRNSQGMVVTNLVILKQYERLEHQDIRKWTHDTHPEGPRVLVTEVEALVAEVRRRRRGHVLEVVIA